MNKEFKYIYQNDSLTEVHTKVFTGLNRGVMYGDGCFETLKYYQGQFLHFDRHFERLSRGLEYLDLENILSAEDLKRQIGVLCRKNGMEFQDVAVRIQCLRVGDAGFATESKKMDYIISLRKIPTVKEKFTLKTTSIKSIPHQALNRKVKLSNSLNFIKAANEANTLGGDDALMLTVNGFISETTMSNLFWSKGDKIYTPNSNCDILPGITRDIIIDIINKAGKYEVIEGEFMPEELLEADSVWACNSIREIFEITGIDQTKFKADGQVITDLKAEFENYKSVHLQS